MGQPSRWLSQAGDSAIQASLPKRWGSQTEEPEGQEILTEKLVWTCFIPLRLLVQSCLDLAPNFRYLTNLHKGRHYSISWSPVCWEAEQRGIFQWSSSSIVNTKYLEGWRIISLGMGLALFLKSVWILRLQHNRMSENKRHFTRILLTCTYSRNTVALSGKSHLYRMDFGKS
jgi:hypothetical protein